MCTCVDSSHLRNLINYTIYSCMFVCRFLADKAFKADAANNSASHRNRHTINIYANPYETYVHTNAYTYMHVLCSMYVHKSMFSACK